MGIVEKVFKIKSQRSRSQRGQKTFARDTIYLHLRNTRSWEIGPAFLVLYFQAISRHFRPCQNPHGKILYAQNGFFFFQSVSVSVTRNITFRMLMIDDLGCKDQEIICRLSTELVLAAVLR